MNLISLLKWRYATKRFDPVKKIKSSDLETIKEAVRLSVSAYGLQLYKVLIITDPVVRQELKKVSWDQPQITDASHLFIFCNYTSDHDAHVDKFIHQVAKEQGELTMSLENYGNNIKAALKTKSADQLNSWTEKQTYLALNNLLISCAELGIDACPMEGFDPGAYNKILDLDKQGLNASVIAAVGYRSDEDTAQYRIKIRKSVEELFVIDSLT